MNLHAGEPCPTCRGLAVIEEACFAAGEACDCDIQWPPLCEDCNGTGYRLARRGEAIGEAAE